MQVVGAEAQLYLSRGMVEGVVAYGEHGGLARDEYYTNVAHVAAHVYVNDRLTVSGGVGYGLIDYFGGDTTSTTYEVGAEHRIGRSRFSVRANYIRADADDPRSNYSSDTFQVGLVVDLGVRNRRERNERGASLPGATVFDTHMRLWPNGYGAS